MLGPVSEKDMRRIEEAAGCNYGVSGALLMEHAGRSIAERLARLAGRETVVFVCGPGKNGGDGLCAARHLEQLRGGARVIVPDGYDPSSEECRVQWRLLQKLPVKIYTYARWLSKTKSVTASREWWVDALFGIGLNRPIGEPYSEVIRCLNGHPSGRVVAVDMPSGLGADNGLATGPCVRAGRTLVLGRMKRGLRMKRAVIYTGRCEILYAGFPQWRHASAGGFA